MKILQVLPDPYGISGGILVHAQNISERLAKKHDVTIYATNRGLELPKYELRNGVNVERFNCYAPGEAYYLSVEMLLKLRKAKFDVVHGHGYHAFPLHFAHLAKADKFIVTPHFHGVGHSTFRNSIVKLLKTFGKRTLKQAYKIVAVSEYEKSLIINQFGINEDKIAVIPNGVDFREFADVRSQNRDSRSILYVGYLIGFKGPQHLIEVLPRFDETISLEIVGRGPLKPYLKKRAHELKVHDRVRFYENLTREELVQKYSEASVFVLLSQYEAYSIVVAEALTAGTPCVVANASALTEWIDNETCFGVDFPINLGELSKRIDFALNKRVDKETMRKWIGVKILDWNDVANKLEGIYEERFS